MLRIRFGGWAGLLGGGLFFDASRLAVFTPLENLTDPRDERTRLHDLFELAVVAL
jgi:hypothetical protein